MFLAQLNQIAEDGDARNFRQILDLGDVRPIEVSNEQIQDGDEGDAHGLGLEIEDRGESHDWLCTLCSLDRVQDRALTI